jgi:SAM-dependent methyltransferase
MILHHECPICKSDNLIGYAIDCYRAGPHISRVKCKDCGIVFANPMADSKELATYYSRYYDKDRYESMNYKEMISCKIEQIKTYSISQIKKEAPYMRHFNQNGKFLDIGCGLGLGLAYANQLGFELYATEFDSGALEFVKSQFTVNVFQGELFDAKYPANYFDFIHISHVIEHVLDPIGYIEEMYRILKPGGILSIGTPDISSRLYVWYRNYKLLTLSVPLIIDGLEHTFIFPKKLLAKLCSNKGFRIRLHYCVSLGETIQNLLSYKIPFKKKVSRYLQNFFKLNQWIVCEK